MLRRPPTLITLTSDDVLAYDQSRAQRLSDAAAQKAARAQQLQQQQQQANLQQQRLRAAGATHPYLTGHVPRTMDGAQDRADLPVHPQSLFEDEDGARYEEQDSSMLAASPSYRPGESFRRAAGSLQQSASAPLPTQAPSTATNFPASQQRNSSQSVVAIATPQQPQQQSNDSSELQPDQQTQMQARAHAEQERRRRRQERIMGHATRGTRGTGTSSR